MDTIVISINGGPYKTFVEQGAGPGPVPPAPPAPGPGPTPPAPPPSGGSLVPQRSTATIEVLSSPRNAYGSTSQPSLPFVLGSGPSVEYVSMNGKSTRTTEFLSLPLIVPANYAGPAPVFDWTAAPWEGTIPVFAMVSATADDSQVLQSFVGRSPMPNGNGEWSPPVLPVAALYYFVLKLAAPGSGDKLFSIRV